MLQKTSLKARTGGQVLVDQLLIHGADTAYCVPGESYLEVLDALHDVQDRFNLINARHEAGAANMAETYGKLTGKPGICMVTRGPGACHAAIGVHIAQQDSTPMILLVGQIARDTTDREAFQEVDYRAMFGPIAKWATQIDDPARVPEYMARAFRVATSGRPGPVVISLPEDMLTEVVSVADARPYTATHAGLSPDSLDMLKTEIAQAERPLLLLGGSGWSDESAAAITRFAEANKIPVTTSFRRQDIVNNLSPVYAGDFGTSTAPSLYAHQREADLLIVIGARLGEMTTKTYTTMQSPNPETRLVHLYPEADEIGRVYSPDLGIAAAPVAVAAALDGVDLGRAEAWGDWCDKLHADYLTDTEAPNGGEWDLDMGVALAQLRDELPNDVVVTLDAGNHTGWAQRFLRFGRPGRIVGSTCGAMGYSVPAAVAASIADPERLTLSFVGDGGFMMSGNELATAAQYGGRPIVLLFNNGIYGTIRMHQERDHPERISGTTLQNQDFVKMAEGLGAHAERVTKTEDFAAAFTRARESGRPALIELVTDPEQISTRTTISKLRAAAQKKVDADQR
ncbi:thiamine pyrophosphate-binding protein [Sulfitobacter sp. KE34]|uniref:Thiamine pyrophosphate-binding protein n=1 Tax=Sulfitobacter faviae TaxID=1775881 RepID=A0AAX3LU37_9RHOB|nr:MULTISPECIES: thiamine pyrophosphate-binding protein [Sulfitobacter]MDF3351272.1 thiamine pyrophosphate-binding protein [Sulfitobacter sp. KE12]MDF3354944.1 thiamine pyrophosphate-binding protein [Sulfitobacter sp. KE27]MDF3358592.1 thiamine pyrophosphate-binding protein [Sulfitobacter sp. KE33]MDF3362407.1 thiamine pyrophosphate-binding protein [Sulfitobacter sp. Ks41]MDF3366016.1 thiamine pyrophosphate-binding protein [Sulfitobacter sp. Ks34]